MDNRIEDLRRRLTRPEGWIALKNMPPIGARADAQSDLSEVTAFWGYAPDLIHGFAFSSSWSGMVSNIKTAQAAFPKGQKFNWAIGLATGAQTSAGSLPTINTSNADFAAGTYDAYFNQILDLLLYGDPSGGPIYIRPNWEGGNLTAYPWGATINQANARADFRAAFQRASNLIRAKSSRFVIEFCMSIANFDYTATAVNPFDPTTGFDPGSAYYDLISPDIYLVGADISNGQNFDGFCHARSPAPFLYSDVTAGLQLMADTARANGKGMSIPEWGIGADRPDFIRAMAAFVADPRNRVAYHGYWNKNAGTPVSGQYPFPCRLSGNSNNYPLAKAAFLSSFFGTGVDTSAKEQPDTSGLVARTTTTINSMQRAVYDTAYSEARSAGLWPYIDTAYFLYGPNNEIVTLNFFGAGGYTTTVPRTVGRLGVNGSPTFTPKSGYAGTGAGGTTPTSYLRANSTNPTSASGTKMTLNSAFLAMKTLTMGDNAGAAAWEFGNANSAIGVAAGGDRFTGRVSAPTSLTLTNAGVSGGHVIEIERTSSTNWAAYLDGVATGKNQTVQACTSTSLTSDDLRICGVLGLGAGVNTIAAVVSGAALPASAPFNGHAALNTWINNFVNAMASA